jgi:hypothetical protein
MVSPLPEWVDQMWILIGGGDDGDRNVEIMDTEPAVL